jgi:hypothetical protein
VWWLNNQWTCVQVWVSIIGTRMVRAPRAISTRVFFWKWQTLMADANGRCFDKHYFRSSRRSKWATFLSPEELEVRTKDKEKSWFQDICVIDRSDKSRGWRDHRAQCLLLMRIVAGSTLGMGRCQWRRWSHWKRERLKSCRNAVEKDCWSGLGLYWWRRTR